MEHDCDFELPGCIQDATHVAYLGASGDRYACGVCMNQVDEPDLFVPVYEVTGAI